MSQVFENNKLIFTLQLLATGQPVFSKKENISITREKNMIKKVPRSRLKHKSYN